MRPNALAILVISTSSVISNMAAAADEGVLDGAWRWRTNNFGLPPGFSHSSIASTHQPSASQVADELQDRSSRVSISPAVRAGSYLGSISPSRASQILASEREGVTVSYAWRGLTVEGAARRTDDEDETPWRPRQEESIQVPSRSTRFSYNVSPGLALQFSRGTWSSVDQLVAEGQIKRTSLAASYTRRHTGGEWLTTFAWGRSAHKGRPSVYGYLAESSVRFSGAHVAFGRVEQTNVDDLPGVQFPYSPDPKIHKLSFGYYQDLYKHRGTRLGGGVMASRYFLPNTFAQNVGQPTTFMFFVRVKLQ